MSYLFVGGSQRSGTSLLLRILCDDPETNPYFGECSYPRTLLQAYEHGLKTFDELRHVFDSREQFRSFHAGLMQRFFSHCLARFAPATRLVLKEPHMTMYFPQLYELLPEQCRFAVLVRDPRDVIASMCDVGERMQQKGVRNVYTEGDISKLSQLFMSFYVKLFNACREDAGLRERVHFVSYEKLVSEPEKALKGLRAFTGLSLPADEVPGQRSIRQQLPGRSGFWQTELTGQAISENRVRRYRERLSPAQIRQVETHCRDFMKVCHYEADNELAPDSTV